MAVMENDVMAKEVEKTKGGDGARTTWWPMQGTDGEADGE
jgi:hypothetical protein